MDLARLGRALNPKTVAVIGDSKSGNFEWLRAELSFKGKLYSVHVNPDTFADIKALGVTNYTSLLDIPEPVDLAVVAVSRKAALAVLDDCIRKGVAAAHFFTSGFSETRTEEGRQYEHALVEKAKSAGFPIIGPNCMGIFNPAVGIRQSEDQYTDHSGPLGFLSQSGSVAISFSLEADQQGIAINKSVSYGNGIIVDSPDFLEFYAQDKDVKIIGMYIEGVKNGRRLFDVLKRVAREKPVVIWRGGRTEEGGRAIGSHTGSMASPRLVWEAVIRQCGAIQVASQEELIDTIKVLLFLPHVKGNRMALAGGPGGQSVTGTDMLAETGLSVPSLTPKSYAELESFFDVVGGSYRNPIDTAGPVRRDMKRIMTIVAGDANIDNIAYLVGTRPGRHLSPEQFNGTLALLEEIKKHGKPLVTVVNLYNPDAAREAREAMLKLQEHGIPAFPSLPRAARALKNALDYYAAHGPGNRDD